MMLQLPPPEVREQQYPHRYRYPPPYSQCHSPRLLALPESRPPSQHPQPPSQHLRPPPQYPQPPRSRSRRPNLNRNTLALYICGQAREEIHMGSLHVLGQVLEVLWFLHTVNVRFLKRKEGRITYFSRTLQSHQVTL